METLYILSICICSIAISYLIYEYARMAISDRRAALAARAARVASERAEAAFERIARIEEELKTTQDRLNAHALRITILENDMP